MKIFTKLLFSFLVLSLIPLLLFTFFSSVRWTQLTQDEQIDSLSEILKSRMNYISEYFANMEKQATLMGRTQNISEAMLSLTDSSGSQLKELDSFIRLFANSLDISDVYLIDQSGTISYSLQQARDIQTNLYTGPYKDTQLAHVFKDVSSSLNVATSEFDLYPIDNKPKIFIGAPIFFKGDFLGVFAFQIPPSAVYKIFQDYTSLKETGEVLIAKKTGNELLFVNPIRHNPHAAFNLKISTGSNLALPMQEAVQQISGKGKSIDYRNQEVLAVWGYFPHLKWGIVVKIDLNEALAPVKYIRNLMFLIAGITVLIILLVVIMLAQRFSKPIQELEKAFEDVGKGNLEVELQIYSSDEVGNLSKSFMQMVQELKESTTSIEKLNQEINERKKSEQIKTELISRVSHELRTPMTPIQEGVELLLEDKERALQPQQREILSLIHQNTNRLMNLINEMLSAKTIDERKENFNLEEHDMNSILQSVVQIHLEKAQAKSLPIKLNLASDLPKIHCDRGSIQNAFSSILDNAIKFTERGEIVISSYKKQDVIEIVFKDTGIGISEEDQNKLFQQFRELSIQSEQKKQGLGLSLAICAKIISSHNGKIWVTSNLGKGSAFYIQLPVKKQ